MLSQRARYPAFAVAGLLTFIVLVGVTLDPSLFVTRVNTSREDPPALPDSADRAREITRALEEVVRGVRR